MSRWKIDGTRIARALAWCTAAFACAAGRIAWAAQAAQTAQQEFVPISPSDIPRENLPAGPLIYTAYAFVWVALVAYVFLLWRRLGRVERDLADVSSRLAARK